MAEPRRHTELRRSGPPARNTEIQRGGRLRAQSAKRRRQQKVRAGLAFEYLGAPCRLATEVCTGAAEHWHELVGSGQTGSRVDRRNLVPSCDACNGHVETLGEQAYVNGWKVRSTDAVPGDGGLVPALPNRLAIAWDNDPRSEEWT